MENMKELQKTFQKRNFYTTKDAGRIFLYALILPLLIGLLFCYVSVAIASACGIAFAEGSNYITELFNNFLWFSIPYSVLSQVVFCGIYFVYNKSNRINQKSCNLSFKKANIWTSLLSAFVGIVCVLGLVWLIEGCFGELFKVIGLKQSSISLPLDTVGWYFADLLILGVVPAIFEELLFRGIIFQGLKEKFSPTASIFLSALLFALMHQNIQQFIYPFILGVMLATLMERTNNLLYTILLHMFNNFTTLTLSYLSNIGVLNLNFKITWWFVLLAIALAGVIFLVFWLCDKYYLKKQKKVEIEKEGEATQTPPMSFGKFPLTLVIGIVVAVVFVVINAL